jgi:hypothetical protein
LPEDPELARLHFRHMTTQAVWISESHHGLRMMSCACGRRYAYGFYELVDWADGDDSQATVGFALTDDETARWSAARPPTHADLGTLLPRRQLVWSRPRGDRTEGATRWLDGPIVRLPHD